jgi:putative ATPase
MRDLQEGRSGDIPAHLKDSHYQGAAKLGRGLSYKFPHDFPRHYTPQQYLPDELKDARYYQYGDNKTEQLCRQYWDSLKQGAE